MRYVCNLFAVRDMERSKRFYREVLGCGVKEDFGANVTLEGGLSLQTLESWSVMTGRAEGDIALKNGAGEAYFEEDELDGFMARLTAMGGVELLHPLHEQPWGQRAVRFYDPDGHIIEVGESLSAVARRFADGGMTVGEIAKRMDVAEEYVRALLK